MTLGVAAFASLRFASASAYPAGPQATAKRVTSAAIGAFESCSTLTSTQGSLCRDDESFSSCPAFRPGASSGAVTAMLLGRVPGPATLLATSEVRHTWRSG